MTAYVSGYVFAAKLLRKVGALDLAMIASDRAAATAGDSADDADRVLTAYQVVAGLLRADQIKDAEQLALSVTSAYEMRVRADEPELLSAVRCCRAQECRSSTFRTWSDMRIRT